MLGLGWQYRWGCIRLLRLQGLLLLAAMSTLRLTGFGIDLIRFHAQSTTVKPPSLWILDPPAALAAAGPSGPGGRPGPACWS